MPREHADQPDVKWGLLDHAAMEEELTTLFGRRVDLVSRRAVDRAGLTRSLIEAGVDGATC